jgi:hypothetical protein
VVTHPSLNTESELSNLGKSIHDEWRVTTRDALGPYMDFQFEKGKFRSRIYKIDYRGPGRVFQDFLEILEAYDAYRDSADQNGEY